MTENEVLLQISRIVNGGLSFKRAVEQIGLLLGSDSCDEPARSFHCVELRDGGETLGTATLCFTSDRFEGALRQRLMDFLGEQLGMLLTRERLAERRAELKGEIARIEEDLAVRKIMQRAEGILIAKRGMAAAVARRWIAQQSQKTGLSKRDVADRIIAYHRASGSWEQRIA